MKTNVWEKVERVFHVALDLPVDDRKSYLRQECAGDDVLFSEVESLLSSYEEDSDFILDEPVFELGLEIINDKTQQDLSGSVIGYYELQEKIGSGGMGEVYKAVDTRLNRRVALKFLSESLANDNSAKRRLLKEAQAVAMLEHPNICAVHGIEQSDKSHFLVMQFIEGTTLTESLGHQPVTVKQFKLLARQILTAVAFAHSHGVIHRDLKPGNIMVNGDGQIKVLDFGLAQILPQNHLAEPDAPNDVSRFSQNGLVVGTVLYMSPEQLRGEKLDYRSDIFSVGIVLYELIAGQNPFRHKSQAEIIAAVLNDKPAALEKIAPDYPQILVNLVEKCLQKNKEDRFQSVAEILVELDNAESANIRKRLSIRRKRFLMKAAVAAVFVAVVWAAIFFYIGRSAPKTLAVLPISFDNPPPEKEYLASGLTQSLIDKLSNLPDLKVKNEYFINRYKGKTVEPQSVGKELNVDVVLTGSIAERDNELFLTTRLIRTFDNLVLDINESKVEETNLIELQETLSARIIGKITSKLTDEDKNRLAKKDTESAEARRLYDQGRFHLKRREGGDDLEKAIRYFTDAKDLDQNYAKAWTGLASAYIYLSMPGVKGAVKPETAVGLARTAAERAVRLDDTLCESYYSLGLINFRYDWKWNEAEVNFRTAINRDPEFLPARSNLVNLLGYEGRLDEAMEEAGKIKEYDPFSLPSDLEIAKVYYRKKDFEKMDQVLAALLEKFPGNKAVYYTQAYEFLNTGKFAQAAAILEKMYKSDKPEERVFPAAALGFAYAKMGRRTEALKIIDDLEMIGKTTYVPAQEKALIYVGLGDYDKVFENLNRSCDEKFQALPGWVTDPIVDEVKSDPRFVKIKRCVNL